MNMRSIIYTLGWVLKIEGLFMALPVVTAAIYGEQQGFAYAAVMGLCLILGMLLSSGSEIRSFTPRKVLSLRR